MSGGSGSAMAMTGTASLVDQLDASVVLEDAAERHFGGGKYYDDPLGVFVVRGENLVMIAELDEAKEGEHPTLRPSEDLDAVVDAIEEEEERKKALLQPTAKETWGMGEAEGEV